MVKVSVNATTVIVAGIGILAFMAYRNGLLEKVNPTSDQNIIYDGVLNANENAAVQETLDTVFARATLINPFASEEAKKRARDLLSIFYGK